MRDIDTKVAAYLKSGLQQDSIPDIAIVEAHLFNLMDYYSTVRYQETKKAEAVKGRKVHCECP